MIEFNHAILISLILSGFRSLRTTRISDAIILIEPGRFFKKELKYSMSIFDSKAVDMATAESINIQFVIDEKYL